MLAALPEQTQDAVVRPDRPAIPQERFVSDASACALPEPSTTVASIQALPEVHQAEAARRSGVHAGVQPPNLPEPYKSGEVQSAASPRAAPEPPDPRAQPAQPELPLLPQQRLPPAQPQPEPQPRAQRPQEQPA